MALTAASLALRAALGLFVAAKLASSGYKRGSLSQSGAVAAFVVGTLSFSAHVTFGGVLLLFYGTGSKLTRLQSSKKKALEDFYVVGGERGAAQVLSCSIFAVVAGLWHLALELAGRSTALRKALAAAVLGHFACCAGDTWASEIGVLAKSRPRLVTTLFLREVPPGTNGGMSLLGTLASGMGGACMGLGAILLDWAGPRLGFGQATGLSVVMDLVLGSAMGLFGSLLDSLLGATVQATYYDDDRKIIVSSEKKGEPGVKRLCGADILSNEQVNLVSVLLVTLASGGLYAVLDEQWASGDTAM